MPLDLCVISGTLFNNVGVAQGGATLFVVKVVKSDTVIWQQQIAAAVSDSVTGAVEFAVPRDSTAWISGYFWIGSTDFNVNDGVMVVIPDAATANLEDLGIAVVAPSTYATQTLLDAETAARIAADATKQPLATGTPDGTKFLRDDNSWQPAAGGSAWGGITGTLSAQTDLQALFDAIGPRNAANGYAGLSASGLLTESQIPSSIARDSEVQALTDALQSAVDLKADIASPVFTTSAESPVFLLPDTTGASVGVVKFGGDRFIHNFTNADALANELGTLSLVDAYNTYLGVLAGNFTSSGSPGTSFGGRNIAIGYLAGSSNTTGWQNTAVGFRSQQKTTSGIYNTTLGAYTLVENTTGENNTAIGADVLWLNTTGANNTGVGTYALQQNTTALHNSALGANALRNTTTGGLNTALGSEALLTNTTGVENTAVGYRALRVSVAAQHNVAVGTNAMKLHVSGNANVAVGAYSLPLQTAADNNVAIGFGAGEGVTTGSNNVLIGKDAGLLTTTGANNTLLGYKAGDNISTGGTNIIIGASVDADSATANSQLNIGGAIKGDLSTGLISVTGQLRAASLGVGNSAAGSTPGTVTKKIEVFDAAGASLGFVAVYDAIT